MCNKSEPTDINYRAEKLLTGMADAVQLDSREQVLLELDAHKLALIKQQKINEKTTRLLEGSQAIARVGCVELDLATREYYWSKETYRIHDTTPEEYVPTLKDALDSYLPDSKKAVKAGLTDAITKGKVFDLDTQKRTFKGRLIDIRSTCLITREAGKPIKLTGIYQDITAQKRAERRHIHHNNILQLLLQDVSLVKILNAMVMGIENINPDAKCRIKLIDSKSNKLHACTATSFPSTLLRTRENVAIHPHSQKYKIITRRKSSHACWCEPISDSSGKHLGTLALYLNQPVTPTPADIALLESESRLIALAIETVRSKSQLKLAASVFTNVKEGIVITDLAGNIVEVNKTFEDITGFNRDEVIGRNPRIFRSEKHEQYFFAKMWKHLIEKGFWNGEIWNVKKDGQPYAAMMTISAVRDTDGNVEHYVSLFNDISLLREHQQQLEFIAHFDALTQLPNRVLLADRLNQAIANSNRTRTSIAVLYIDLDGFKNANDSYGHGFGDNLLVTIAQRLKATLREGDTLARVGGDEFVVVLAGLNNEVEHEPLVKRLLDAAGESVAIEGKLVHLSASIGITLYPSDNAEPEQLIRNADQAMYAAKQAGKNCFQLFDIEFNTAMKNRYETIERIRVGLNNKELKLYYQPKVNMRSGEIIGLEALIRWQHPNRGLLLPQDFLPTIDCDALGLDVGAWVIREALVQLQKWFDIGFKTSVSVNVSGYQLLQVNFVENLSLVLADFPEISPKCLTLEILETSALEDVAEVAETMRRCAELGIEFAVDDFGTGYSSLTYLKRLPARLLKIDKSFIHDMLEDKNDLAIVKGVISLATAFQCEVIAEGIENSEQGERLLTLGCDLAQGYGIARPMAAEHVPEWTKIWVQDAAWLKHPMQQCLRM